MASRMLMLGAAGGLGLYFRPLQAQLTTYTQHAGMSAWLLGAGIAIIALSGFARELVTAWTFAWNCFFQPLGKNASQEGRLNRFYQGQAAIYDKTRSKLLRGRSTMLKLSAAHLREQRRKNPNKRLIWLDIGGGTGWNYFPIKDFDAVYVLDLCGPLLEVSRKRFEARGWKNVQCLLQDATHFVLPDMMPDHLTLLDRVERFLHPSGLFSVCDFYVSARETTSVAGVIGDVTSRQCSWLTRWFWLHWFELDHVDLHPSRRQYLEHRFYVSLHTSRRVDTSSANQAYEIDAGNTISASPSPLLMPTLSRQASTNEIPDLALGVSAALSRSRSRSSASKPKQRVNRAYSRSSDNSDKSDSVRIDIAPEVQLSAFHYGYRHWRVPYIDDPVHHEFRTFTYAFAWEDPRVDMEHLKINKDDSVLCITSGDAIDAQPRRIHTVDFNPCQGHVLELKLACIYALEYEDFWLVYEVATLTQRPSLQLFGEGRHPNFRELLDSKLSPFLTSHAYQYWRKNDHISGHALRLAYWALRITGMYSSVHKMCAAPTLEEQRRIWTSRIRPIILSAFIRKVFLANPIFQWNSLGVPINQARVFLKETTTSQFAIDALDPIGLNSHVAKDNYFYQLCLEAKYTKDSCPLYLTREGFEKLKQNDGAALDCFRLHTDSIMNVMNRLGKDSLTIAIIMDLQDWFPNTVDSPPAPGSKPCELTQTIRTLRNALKPNGRVFFRSAGQEPWYLELYRREGFKVECIHKRPIGGKIPIDRVNMRVLRLAASFATPTDSFASPRYASFYCATKK
uniref:Betaine lipid synthase n=1 Tax=Rhodotorula toruloides TaxID=5286 RepID=A0A0K3CN82_RHOTO